MSVVNQSTSFQIEILVGVDKSSDDTLAIVKRLERELPDVVRCIEHTTRLGCGARNLQSVLKQASGDLIAHVDGDDFWRPGKLEAQADFLKKHPRCSAVYTNASVIDKSETIVGVFSDAQPDQFSLDYLVTRGNFINHSSTLYRSEFKNLLLNLDTPFIDYQIHLLFAQQGDLGFINKALAMYRIDAPLSIRHTMNEQVRELYWQALISLKGTHVSNLAFVQGKSEVLRQAFFSSVENKDADYFFKWWKRVSSTEPNRKSLLVFFLFVAVSRRLFISNKNRLRKLYKFHSTKIYHIR